MIYLIVVCPPVGLSPPTIPMPKELNRREEKECHARINQRDDTAILKQFLFDNNFNLTVHGDTHQFFYWLDEFASPHYIASRVLGGKYGMLFVAEDGQLSLQDCAATCSDAILQN